MTDEKRKYIRFECIVPVELVEIEGMSGEESRAIIDNVSREGLGLILDLSEGLDAGSSLNLKFVSPDRRKTYPASGEIVWSKPKGKKVEIGLKIKSMAPAAKAELLELGFERWRAEKSRPGK